MDPNWVHRIFDFKEWPKLTASGFAGLRQDAKRVADLTNIGVANAEKLSAHLQSYTPDLAYCFGLHGIGLATASPLAQKRIPILWHAGNYLIAQDLQLRNLFASGRKAHRFAMHFMAARAKRMILSGDYSHIAFLSEAMKREFVKMGYEPPHSYIIPRGIDFPCAQNVNQPREPIFLMASRIGAEKGYDVVFEALQILSQKSKIDWVLRIAGSGDPVYVEGLKSKAKQLGIAGRVQFLGMLTREEVLDEMRAAYAFISASLWEEPFGRTNIEALACGAALIAADTGAIKEIVGDSNCAEIYPKTNSESLANIMLALLSDPSRRTTLAERGISRIKSAYTIDKILDMTEDVFAKVMADYGRPYVRPSRGQN